MADLDGTGLQHDARGIGSVWGKAMQVNVDLLRALGKCFCKKDHMVFHILDKPSPDRMAEMQRFIVKTVSKMVQYDWTEVQVELDKLADILGRIRVQAISRQP